LGTPGEPSGILPRVGSVCAPDPQLAMDITPTLGQRQHQGECRHWFTATPGQATEGERLRQRPQTQRVWLQTACSKFRGAVSMCRSTRNPLLFIGQRLQTRSPFAPFLLQMGIHSQPQQYVTERVHCKKHYVLLIDYIVKILISVDCDINSNQGIALN